MSWVKLGNLWWMTRNFSGIDLIGGGQVPEVTGNAAWAALTTPGWCWYNNTADADWRTKYGRLYNWYAVEQLLTPNCCRVATKDDFDTLATWLIANGYNWDGTTSGDKWGKSIASAAGEWDASATEGHVGNNQATNNKSGMTLIPGGYRLSTGSFSGAGSQTYIWTATSVSADNAWRRYLGSATAFANQFDRPKKEGFSVRLVRETSPYTSTDTVFRGSFSRGSFTRGAFKK